MSGPLSPTNRPLLKFAATFCRELDVSADLETPSGSCL